MKKREPVQSKINQDEFLKQEVLRLETAGCLIAGALIFGSQASGEARPDSDVDLGIIYEGTAPEMDRTDTDVFVWSVARWDSGFPLQIEIARKGRILYDPRGIVLARLTMIREQILPYWEIHLKRL